MKLRKEDYVAKIVNASPLQLTIINYELILDNIAEARENAENLPLNLPLYEDSMQKARLFLRELQESLNMKYDISKSLFQIYVYINKLLNTSFFTKDPAGLDEAQTLLSSLLGGWRQIEADSPSAGPVMENAQQVYAGLTYRNGELSEMIVEDGKRGYTV